MEICDPENCGKTFIRELLQQLWDITPDLVVVTDENGYIILTNPQACHKLGYRYGELEDKSIEMIMPAAKHQGAFLATTTATSSSAAAKIRTLRNRQGDEIEASIRTVQIENRGQSCMLYLIRSETGNELNTDILEHLQQSHQQQMQSSKLEALGYLAGGIAHDLNNILVSIQGYAGLSIAHNAGQDNVLGEYLQQIDTGCRNGSKLIERMMSVTHNHPDNIRVIDLRAELDEALALLKPTLPDAISVEVGYTDISLPFTEFDPVQLKQVLSNILINARDAMPAGGELRIELSRPGYIETRCDGCQSPFEGNFLLLSVRDSGNGIPAEIVPKIFKPLFTTKPEGQGSGMGLAVTHTILHHHGAHIAISSGLANGTQFQLYFPVFEIQDADGLLKP